MASKDDKQNHIEPEITVISREPARETQSTKDKDEEALEFDVDELKDQLGISHMLETKKFLIEQVTAKQAATSNYNASEANIAVKTSDSDGSGFDPSASLLPAVGDYTPDKESSANSSLDSSAAAQFLPSFFEEKEGYGPKVIDVIAERVNDACSKKPLEQKLKELQNKYKTPENCKFICVPKVNVELWHDLERNTKSRDLGLQELQKNVVKAAQPIVMLFDSIAGRAVDPKDILPMLADSITLLGHAPYLCSLKRRELLKPDIAQAYQAVCSKSNPVTTFLFGDELPKHVKDIGKVNKIARRTLTRVSSSRRGRSFDYKFSNNNNNNTQKNYQNS
ncbi:uncharacterized protein LOC116612099 isoform X2 [Nematostella vectensis]|uniref:uncharacterized protein LOC116612099 isoform X2 n=1 Tax=Nematostella vectensis TaxID=45351 RepID=UPI00207715BC|nr:uncharacterized protein LOC116612099 isoform X2 [Nematostella vectensis]XP_048590145.1 uncharacterized protein LOC116612099 isoform X2 [Nematostella vectensis]